MIRIAIAEDNPTALRALEEKLSYFEDIAIVYRAPNGEALLHDLEKNAAVDLILMDLEMPVMDGIAATAAVKQKYPDIRVVVITVYDAEEAIFRAIRAGADSYLLKETSGPRIHECLHDTLRGGAVMSPAIALKTLNLLRQQPSVATPEVAVALSARETEILSQLSQGFSNKIIAEHLFLSPFTVKRHIENIYQKLQAHNRIELIARARNNGLL